MTRLRKMMLEELRRRNYSSDHARNYLRVVTERTATVEVTSEHKDFPIESSLSIEPGPVIRQVMVMGTWRAHSTSRELASAATRQNISLAFQSRWFHVVNPSIFVAPTSQRVAGQDELRSRRPRLAQLR